MFQRSVWIFLDVKERSASAMVAEYVEVSGQVMTMVSTFGQRRMIETRIGRDSASGFSGTPR
jgi:hypothetical protein